MGNSTISDEDLLEQADHGDLDALRQLITADLHPAWRLAVITTESAEAAEAAAVEGFCDGLAAAIRQPNPRLSLRARLATATRHAAITGAATAPRRATPDPDPVVAAFQTLPEAWRTALWLVEVEGGSPEQVAPVLGLNRSAAAALADRAATGLRERLATDVAERATEPDCRRALAKLPAHAAGKLTADERDAVGGHLAGCGSCAVWLAALVSPRPALRRLITPPPASVAVEIEARWLLLLERRGRSWLTPLTELAVGAAAAAVLAIGLGGAMLGGRDDPDPGPELAVPTSTQPVPATPADDVVHLIPPTTIDGVPATTGTAGTTGTRTTTGSGGAGGSSSDDKGTGGDIARGVPTPPAPTDGGTTPPPSTPTPPPAPAPPPSDETAAGVPGVLEVALGQRTAGVEVLDTVTVDLGGPGLVEVGIAGL